MFKPFWKNIHKNVNSDYYLQVVELQAKCFTFFLILWYVVWLAWFTMNMLFLSEEKKHKVISVKKI